MFLRRARIKNFRGLEDIEAEFTPGLSVIVGPNAVGKTSIFEAIRLAKAILAPRTPNETNQVLFALGAGSPHIPNRLIPAALAGDPKRPIEITTDYEIVDGELTWINESIARISNTVFQAQHGQQFANQASLLSYLATDEGKANVASIQQEVGKAFSSLRESRTLRLGLIFDPVAGQMNSTDALGPMFFAAIEAAKKPYETAFNFFPADRALPSGEQPVQLGAADAQQQLESYNSQPQTKYVRLKNTIFNSVVVSPEARVALEQDFNNIFSNVLKGRKLNGFGINEVGMLSIRVQDTETGKIFDLDGMSSGEKGLILTCLIIARSMADNSVVLLDEPELHLNPAICKGLLTFFVDTYVKPKGIQLLCCSHSPEILMGTFERPECAVFHLKSSTKIERARPKDTELISSTLRRLGSSEIDGLLYRGSVFVEGVFDAELLEVGFGDVLWRYKLNDRGGRSEIEKLAKAIQEAEKAGQETERRFFIIDRDELAADIKESAHVRLLQWDRRCIENFLLDIDVITDILKDKRITKNPVDGISSTDKLLRDLAMKQLDEVAVRQVYMEYEYENPGLRAEDVEGKTVVEASNRLFDRLQKVRSQVSDIDREAWSAKFLTNHTKRKAELELLWTAKWIEICDGKRLFEDLKQEIQLNVSVRVLKRMVMQEMRLKQTSTWLAMKARIDNLLK